MAEILHHLGWCWNPINNGINYLSTGAGFQPSTVPFEPFSFWKTFFDFRTSNWLPFSPLFFLAQQKSLDPKIFHTVSKLRVETHRKTHHLKPNKEVDITTAGTVKVGSLLKFPILGYLVFPAFIGWHDGRDWNQVHQIAVHSTRRHLRQSVLRCFVWKNASSCFLDICLYIPCLLIAVIARFFSILKDSKSWKNPTSLNHQLTSDWRYLWKTTARGGIPILSLWLVRKIPCHTLSLEVTGLTETTSSVGRMKKSLRMMLDDHVPEIPTKF